MPNGKTHFIAAAVVGATVNVLIQSAEMAMDYDRPFDWSEFFLCTGAGAFAVNPKGIASFSPGLRGTSYPGFAMPEFDNPERVASIARRSIIHGQDNSQTARQFFHTLLSAALVAWAISGKHTLKFSPATRLALWAFGINHLSHIALDCTPKTHRPLMILPSMILPLNFCVSQTSVCIRVHPWLKLFARSVPFVRSCSSFCFQSKFKIQKSKIPSRSPIGNRW
jgi:hypothetical protein